MHDSISSQFQAVKTESRFAVNIVTLVYIAGLKWRILTIGMWFWGLGLVMITLYLVESHNSAEVVLELTFVNQPVESPCPSWAGREPRRKSRCQRFP